MHLYEISRTGTSRETRVSGCLVLGVQAGMRSLGGVLEKVKGGGHSFEMRELKLTLVRVARVGNIVKVLQLIALSGCTMR